MSIDQAFFGGGSEPFFDGEYAATRQIPFTISLAGRSYPIDLTKYRKNGLTRFRQGVITSGEPNDNLLSSEGAWWRYRFAWHLGEGQDIDELDEDASPARFEASRGVDPWTKYELCLQPATESVLAVGATDIHMVATGSHLYVSDGATLKRSADLTTWNTITGLTGTIQDLASDGTNCYVATTTNVYTIGSSLSATTTTTATAPSGGYDQVAFVGNRLMAGASEELYEIGTTTIDLVYTHFQAAFRWRVIFAVGSRIYVGGYAGNRSELYSLTTDDTGALIRSAEAASFFAGELLLNALSYGGIVILCTSEGIRIATVESALQYGPLISAPGSSKAIAAQGRYAWFGWESFPGDGCGLGRLALDEFVAPLQPPYATDVFTEAVDDTIEAVARFNDRTVFAVSGAGIYASTPATFVTEGYVDSGQITMGTVEDKLITGLRLRYNALEAGEEIQAVLTEHDGTSIVTNTSVTVGGEESDIPIDSGPVNRAKLRINLTGDGSSSPCLTEWRMRAYPIAPGVEEWLVPLIIKSRVVVNDSEGQMMSMDPWSETARIRELWQTSDVVQYEEGDHAFRVRVDNFQIDTAEWRDGSDWFEVTCTVRLLGV